MVDRSTSAYISRIQASNILATVASGGRGSKDGGFSAGLSTTLGKIDTVNNRPLITAPSGGIVYMNSRGWGSLTVTWKNNTTVTDTLIKISTTPSGPWIDATLAADSTNFYGFGTTTLHPLGAAKTANVISLNPMTTYYFKLISVTAAGQSGSSDVFSGTTSAT